jgi:hypothetical protein
LEGVALTVENVKVGAKVKTLAVLKSAQAWDVVEGKRGEVQQIFKTPVNIHCPNKGTAYAGLIAVMWNGMAYSSIYNTLEHMVHVCHE